VLYLFEAGPDAMYTFFSELAEQKTHDQALAAALGIPEERAVEAFEKMWVDWMKRRYVLDLKPDVGEKSDATLAELLDAPNVLPPVDELAAANGVSDWRLVMTDTLSKDFCGVGETLEDWSVSEGMLKSVNHENPDTASYLGVDIHEKRPFALRCKYRMNSGTEADRWAGFSMLDAAKNDLGIQVLAPMTEGTEHDMVVVLDDELVVYVDGVCTGRQPAPVVGRLEATADFPLAFVSYGPLEVWDVQAAHIKDLKSAIPKPPEGETPTDSSGSQSQPSRGRGRGRR